MNYWLSISVRSVLQHDRPPPASHAQANGDPEDHGFAGSWYTGRVVAVDKSSGNVTVEYDEVRSEGGVWRLRELPPPGGQSGFPTN